MWKLIMKFPYNEVKFYPEVKSQTGSSSLRVSSKPLINQMYFVQSYFE